MKHSYEFDAQAIKKAYGPPPYLKVDVVYPRPVPGVYSYVTSLETADLLHPGCAVFVPLGNSVTTAYVVKVHSETLTDVESLKPVLTIIDVEPLFSNDILELTRFVAEYYFSQWGWVLKQAIPPGVNPEEVKKISITRKGTEELQNNLNSLSLAVEKKIMLTLNEQGKTTTYVDLMKGVKPLRLSLSHIRNLEEKGLLLLHFAVRKKEQKSGPDQYRLAGSEDEIDQYSQQTTTRAPKRKELLDLLIQHYPSPKQFTVRDVNALLSKASRFLPALIKDGIVEVTKPVDGLKDYMLSGTADPIPPYLMAEQEQVLNVVTPYLDGKFHVFLLHGVTGSGKTEVYLRAAEHVITKKHKDVLLLVPEISLTPAMVSRIRSRFPGKTSVLHSGLDSRERLSQWYTTRDKGPRIVLGTRSAVFAPVRNLGLLIIDEEHDTSFKQATNPSYSARDTGIMRAFNNQCPVILGSATPSLESFMNAKQNKYTLLTMKKRVDDRALPPVTIVDMRDRKKKEFRSRLISEEILLALEESISRQEQALIFVPRRGFSNFVICHDCGNVPHCTHCSVSYTYHKAGDMLKCHYCGKTIKLMKTCPECNSDAIRGMGVGTQTVHEELTGLFPESTIERMDTDSVRGRNVTRLLNRLSQGEIDILIGTQMITKGHDFGNVTLVGVVAADVALYLPDFRAAERTFQVLTQVAGRTGRGSQGGQVILQSHNPDHHSIVAAQEHDYHFFSEKELKFRQSFRFPPFRRLATILITGKDQGKVIKSARNLKNICLERPQEIQVLGPAPAPLARIKDYYRWQLIVKSVQAKQLADFVREKTETFTAEHGDSKVTLTIDIDPLFML